MFIDRLIVRKTAPSICIIRDIKFNRQGLSLIVDNTNTSLEGTGNSVGKTTAIKIIDICLGAKNVKDLYYDSDTRSENVEIKEFIKTNKLQAELILGEGDERVSIKRDLFPRGNKYIDGIPYPEKEFQQHLKLALFGNVENHPTFRQLIPKFVRLSNASEDGMIKYLPRMTTNDVYDAVYSFFFDIMGTDVVSRKNELSIQLQECQRAIATLEKSKSISSMSVLRQKQEIVEKDLGELVEKRGQISYIDVYKEEIEKKSQINSLINELQKRVQLIQFEIRTIDESKQQIKSDERPLDITALERIYREANSFIPDLQKTFQEMLQFHEKMIENRYSFIDQKLSKKQNELAELKAEIDRLLKQKVQQTVDALDEGLLQELNQINKRIEELSVQKGELLQSIRLLEEHERTKSHLLTQLNEIEELIDNDQVDNKIKLFNQTFSEYCYKLYGEKYILAYNSNWKSEKKFPVTAESVGGNVGTGKKKALIVAFDLAYLKYIKTQKLHYPEFVIHDKLESTHINQLKTIFEICQDIEGQYILPILRERIDKVDDEAVEAAMVLELSEEYKFFGV